MREERDYQKMWCPLGRVSIQNPGVDTVNVVPCGAFNTVLYSPKLGASGGEGQKYLVTTCLGPQCVYYRRKWRKWGRCALSNDCNVTGIFAAGIVSAVALAGIVVFILAKLQG